MIEEILTATYYGNTVKQWGIALFIVLGAFVLGKIIYWISTNVFKKLATNTKTKLDDIIVDMIEEPAVFAITLAGVWIAEKTLIWSDGFSTTFDTLFQALVVFNVAWLLTRLFDAMLKEYFSPLVSKSQTDLDDHLLPILSKGSRIIIWAMAVIIALNNAGYDVAALIAGLGIGGIALAMAAKDTISNIFGGVTIFTDHPFKMKDTIKVSGVEGTVEEIGIRTTRIRTYDGRIVTIPNASFIGNFVENISSEPSRKVVNTIGLVYDTTPAQMEKAMGLLKDIALKNKNVEENASVSFSELASSSMNLTLIYYIKKGADIGATKGEINLEILKQFSKNKLEMAFPTQTIYTKH